MEFSEITPSLSEFISLVNESNFTKEDIELQSKTASKVGYDSFEHYLEFQYFIYHHLFIIQELIDEVNKDLEIHHKIKGNLVSKVTKHVDHSIEDELKPIFERVQKLPVDIQSRLYIFEDKLRTLYIQSTLDNISKDDSLKNTVTKFLNDLANQYSLAQPEAKQSILNTISYLDGVSYDNTNKLIAESNSDNYYFKKQTSILQKLHDELVIGKYIEKHDAFVNVFRSQNRNPHLNSILWIEETPKLFYLLLRLNDNIEYVNGSRIDYIAYQLFTFHSEKTSDNIRTAYNSMISKMKDEHYIDKKMQHLNEILNRILIK